MLFNLNIILKYIILIGLTYLILTNIPSNELCKKDILLICILLFIILYIFDYLNNNLINNNNNNNNNNNCSIFENMTNPVTPTPTVNVNPTFTPTVNPTFTPTVNPTFTPTPTPTPTVNINPTFTPKPTVNINPTFTPTITQPIDSSSKYKNQNVNMPYNTNLAIPQGIDPNNISPDMKNRIEFYNTLMKTNADLLNNYDLLLRNQNTNPNNNQNNNCQLELQKLTDQFNSKIDIQ